MLRLEYYLSAARTELNRLDAFVYADRGRALLVSDLPRRGRLPADARARLEAEFELIEKDGLMYLTPLFADAPKRLRPLCTRLLKLDSKARDVMTRKALAECMRLGDEGEIAFMKAIFEGRDDE